MDVGASAFASFSAFIEMETIELYAEASNRMREQLQRKSETLGEHGRVSVQPIHAGFARVRVPARPDMEQA